MMRDMKRNTNNGCPETVRDGDNSRDRFTRHLYSYMLILEDKRINHYIVIAWEINIIICCRRTLLWI